MTLVRASTIVSPLGLNAAEHVFMIRAEGVPHSSGAFTDDEDQTLLVLDAGWIPASRPWASRIALLVKRAIASLGGERQAAPIVLIAPPEALEGAGDVRRFLAFAGHPIVSVHSGEAGFVTALADARERLATVPEVIVAAVDSMVSRPSIEAWLEHRYSPFTTNPLPPSEGAAALALVAGGGRSRIVSLASQRSEATDDNDLPNDGGALTRVFAELGLPAKVDLLVGQFAVDPLRTSDDAYATARHATHFETTTMLSLESKVGRLGAASGLASVALALAWLEHGAALADRPRAVAWARGADGTVGGALVEGAPEPDPPNGVRRVSPALVQVDPRPPRRSRATTASLTEELPIWDGPVKLRADRATGSTAANIEERTASDLFERLVVIGSDHAFGPHVDRPALRPRILAHLDALAEIGICLDRLEPLLEEVDLERRGVPWTIALLYGSLALPSVEDSFEAWLSSIDVAELRSFAVVSEVARALAVVPNRRLADRCAAWLTSQSPLLGAIAIEASDPASLSDAVVARALRPDDPLRFAAVERAFARSSRAERRAPAERPTFREVQSCALAGEIACARTAAGDDDAISALRVGEPAAFTALGPHAMDVIALSAEPFDDDLARSLALRIQTTHSLLDAMGRAGLPSCIERLVRELASDDFSAGAERALVTALGEPGAGVPTAAGRAWEPALASLAGRSGAVRLRFGQPHAPSSILLEMRRRDLNEDDLFARGRELERRAGKVAVGRGGSFGETLEPWIGVFAELAR